MIEQDHFCNNIEGYPTTQYLQIGQGRGRKIIILGEAPAPNGWRKSGRAFYTIEGKLLPTGKNLNELLVPYEVSVETCSFTELVKCFVGDKRSMLDACGKLCWPILMRQFRELDGKIIILLGVKTLAIFNKLAQQNLLVGAIASITLQEQNYFILPIYHPSPIGPLNHKKNKEIFLRVHEELKNIMQTTVAI